MLFTASLSLVWLDIIVSSKSHSFDENESIFISRFPWQVTSFDKHIPHKAQSHLKV